MESSVCFPFWVLVFLSKAFSGGGGGMGAAFIATGAFLSPLIPLFGFKRSLLRCLPSAYLRRIERRNRRRDMDCFLNKNTLLGFPLNIGNIEAVPLYFKGTIGAFLGPTPAQCVSYMCVCVSS